MFCPILFLAIRLDAIIGENYTIYNMIQYGEVNSVKNTTINIWLNDGVY